MKDIKKYQGVIPAFYACYDAEGNISVEGVKALTRHLIAKGVKGVYVGGSSGECIYQHVEERKTVLEAVMSEAKGKLTVIAHVGCNNTADSMELARHAESVGVDAIASIPPIYFHLPEYAIAKYWNDMSAAAPNSEFVIYNIPQLAGTALTMSLLNEMLKNPNVVAVKNRKHCGGQRPGRAARFRPRHRCRRRHRRYLCRDAGVVSGYERPSGKGRDRKGPRHPV